MREESWHKSAHIWSIDFWETRHQGHLSNSVGKHGFFKNGPGTIVYQFGNKMRL